MLKKITLLLLTALLLLTVSCNNKPGPEPEYSDYVVVLNQGNYNSQDGSISLYSEKDNTVTNRVFESANGNISIGACLYGGDFTSDGRLLILCSNPDKVLVINPYTFQLISTLNDENLSSGRSICSDNNYVYISNYGTTYTQEAGTWVQEYIESYVSIYNISTLSFVDTVRVGSDAEGMVKWGNNLYVATKQGITVIDVPTRKVTSKISDASLGAAKYLLINGSNGTIYASFPAYGIAEISTSSNSITKKYQMEIDDMDGYIAINSDYSNIYSYKTTYDENWNIVSAHVNELNLSTGAAKIFAEGDYFYGVGANPFNDNIYASDVSFSSNSLLKVFDKNGTSIGSHAVGIGTYRFLYMRF